MNVLDLFSGIGGFSLGLERAGMRTVAFCEFDPYCRAVLRKHWPEVPIFEDVRTLTAADVPGVDVICGGFPCQDISTAGKGVGIDGERSGLWSEYGRLIGEIRPRYVVVENVAALLGRGLSRVLGDLAAIGYDAEWHCIPASHVGAPHRRDRVWIVAYPMRGRNGAPETVNQSALDKERDAQTSGQGWQAESGQAGRDGDVADAPGERRGETWSDSKRQEERITGCCAVSDAQCDGCQQMESSEHGGTNRQRTADQAWASTERWWSVEPDVGRVAHGVPSRVDRLRSLGNAVVPQIPEIIGRAIMRTTVMDTGTEVAMRKA